MTTVAAIISRARLELGDNPEPFTTSIVADGVSRNVELPVHPVGSATVLVNGVEMDPEDYDLEADDGIITFDTPPAVDATITVTGTSYWYFLDSEWEIFVREAVNFHLQGRETKLAGLPVIEEPLVAWLAVIEAVWSLLGSAVGDIDIRTPEGTSIPRTQRVAYLTEYAERLRQRYRDHAAMLNVGLHRIETLTIRRTSRATGRLVPVYRAQELEDPSPRERIYPPIPKGLLR